MNDKSRFRIFLACFMTLIAAGVGFAVRGNILGDWSAAYGFTQYELGSITGGGLIGFGIIIILASLITDLVGYRTILILAGLAHVLSLVITVAASQAFESGGKESAYECLYWGMFVFAIANGLCEAAINPLTADLYPNQKTHYLNILHAGWPGGLVIGGLISKLFLGDSPWITDLGWELALGLFLIPTVFYLLIALKEPFPQSEAVKSGVSYSQMLASLASPILLFLFLLHACVCDVELGTDSWIQKSTDAILEGQGPILFVWASLLMFGLRFFAGPIIEKINPIGLLFVSAVIGTVGLAMIIKQRSGAGKIGSVDLVGTVKGCDAIIGVRLCGVIVTDRRPCEENCTFLSKQQRGHRFNWSRCISERHHHPARTQRIQGTMKCVRTNRVVRYVYSPSISDLLNASGYVFVAVKHGVITAIGLGQLGLIMRTNRSNDIGPKRT